MKKRNVLAAAAALLLALVAVVSAEDELATGVYLRRTAQNKPLSANGSEVQILGVSIPAGTWTVTAKANPVNFGAADYVRCVIRVNGVQKDAGSTLVGNAAPGPTGELGPSVATIALQTAIKTTTTALFSLGCSHDFPISGEYVDPWASIMVLKAPGSLGLTE